MYRYSRWNFTNMLFPTEALTISGLRRHLGFSYVGPWQHICTPGLKLWTKDVYDTKSYVFYVLGGCLTFLRHIFRPISISGTFPSIFVIYSSAIPRRVASRKHANSIFRWGAHEIIKVIIENVCCFLTGDLESGTRLFADFLKCTSGFHATMLTFPVEMWHNFIWRQTTLGFLDNVWKAHGRISYSFGATKAKVD